MEVEIRVDRNLCIGSGQCVHVAPRTFDQDDQAMAFVADPLGEAEERVVRAIIACPMQAISLLVDGTTVGAADLRDWMRGINSDDPLVELLGRLSETHHEIRSALESTPSDDGAAITSLTRVHLDEEEGAYAAITALVDPALVDSFGTGHARISTALATVEGLTAGGADAEEAGRAAAALAGTLEDHIRLEETVLFPLALAALGRERRVSASPT